MRSGNELITLDPDDMGPNANLTRSQVLAAGFRKYGVGNDISRVCLSYAIAGLIAMAYSDIDNSSPPPLILDLAGLLDRETKKTTIMFTYMQISLAIGGPKSSNRMSGKMYIHYSPTSVCVS